MALTQLTLEGSHLPHPVQAPLELQAGSRHEHHLGFALNVKQMLSRPGHVRVVQLQCGEVCATHGALSQAKHKVEPSFQGKARWDEEKDNQLKTGSPLPRWH